MGTLGMRRCRGPRPATQHAQRRLTELQQRWRRQRQRRRCVRQAQQQLHRLLMGWPHRDRHCYQLRCQQQQQQRRQQQQQQQRKQEREQEQCLALHLGLQWYPTCLYSITWWHKLQTAAGMGQRTRPSAVGVEQRQAIF